MVLFSTYKFLLILLWIIPDFPFPWNHLHSHTSLQIPYTIPHFQFPNIFTSFQPLDHTFKHAHQSPLIHHYTTRFSYEPLTPTPHTWMCNVKRFKYCTVNTTLLKNKPSNSNCRCVVSFWIFVWIEAIPNDFDINVQFCDMCVSKNSIC